MKLFKLFGFYVLLLIITLGCGSARQVIKNDIVIKEVEKVEQKDTISTVKKEKVELITKVIVKEFEYTPIDSKLLFTINGINYSNVKIKEKTTESDNKLSKIKEVTKNLSSIINKENNKEYVETIKEIYKEPAINYNWLWLVLAFGFVLIWLEFRKK